LLVRVKHNQPTLHAALTGLYDTGCAPSTAMKS